MSEQHLAKGRKKKAKFTNVGQVLSQVVSGLGLDQRLQEQALRQIWPTIVDQPFRQSTRVLFIDHAANLVISARDASTAQEITFAKRDLLKRLYPIARALGLSVKNIRVDLKHFVVKSEEDFDESRPCAQSKLPEPPGEAELAHIELEADEQVQIQALETSLAPINLFVGPTDREPVGQENLGVAGAIRSKEILGMVERQLKLERWRRQNRYPICSGCGYTTLITHSQDALCAECFVRKLGASISIGSQ